MAFSEGYKNEVIEPAIKATKQQIATVLAAHIAVGFLTEVKSNLEEHIATAPPEIRDINPQLIEPQLIEYIEKRLAAITTILDGIKARGYIYQEDKIQYDYLQTD